MKLIIRLLILILILLIFFSVRADALEMETETLAQESVAVETDTETFTVESVIPETDAMAEPAVSELETEAVVAEPVIPESEVVTEPFIPPDTMAIENQTEPTEIPYPTTLEGWEAYLKEEIIPALVLVISSVATIYIAISPLLYKIKQRSDAFHRATQDVNTATGTVAENRAELAKAERELSETVASMRKELSAYRKELKNMNKILRMGFSNQNELVIKGVARKIAKLGAEDPSEEEIRNEKNEG